MRCGQLEVMAVKCLLSAVLRSVFHNKRPCSESVAEDNYSTFNELWRFAMNQTGADEQGTLQMSAGLGFAGNVYFCTTV